MADTATLEARLSEAETALHDLMMGATVVRCEYDGGSTEFTRTSEDKLRRYIASLKRDLGQDVSARTRRVVF